MNSYKTTLSGQSSFNGKIEISYVEPNADEFALIGDLPDNNGIKSSQSHYSATLFIDNKVVATETGITREDAILNCYMSYAKMKAIADMDILRAQK